MITGSVIHSCRSDLAYSSTWAENSAAVGWLCAAAVPVIPASAIAAIATGCTNFSMNEPPPCGAVRRDPSSSFLRAARPLRRQTRPGPHRPRQGRPLPLRLSALSRSASSSNPSQTRAGGPGGHGTGVGDRSFLWRFSGPFDWYTIHHDQFSEKSGDFAAPSPGCMGQASKRSWMSRNRRICQSRTSSRSWNRCHAVPSHSSKGR